MSVLPVHRLFIFDYGAPIAVIDVDEENKKVLIMTQIPEEKFFRGMEIIARLLKRYHGKKTFKFEKYVGLFGDNYIVIGKVRLPHQTASGFGFVIKVLQKIDKLGPAPVDELIKKLSEVFPPEFEIEVKEMGEEEIPTESGE